VHEAKTSLSGSLEQVERGRGYVICRNGKTLADLVCHVAPRRTVPHAQLTKLRLFLDPREIT